MKQTPDIERAQERMRPGLISRDGFLGEDVRPLADIVAEDDQRVAALGITHRLVARRLGYFTDAARRMLGAPAVVDDIYEVSIDESRGVLPCPWQHPGTFPKSLVRLRRLDTGEELAWTELQIHMIETHGFYEGRGSPYRLDPSTAKRVLGI